MSRPRWAAVAVVLRGAAPDLELLLIRRAARAGDPWSGHWAFPGGFGHPGDPDPAATARREAAEELRLALGPALRTLRTRWIVDPWRRRLVRLVPVLFAAPAAEPTPDPAEVAEVRWVRWSALADPAARRSEWRWVRGILPWRVRVREVDGAVIWGLTGAMLDDLARSRASRSPRRG